MPLNITHKKYIHNAKTMKALTTAKAAIIGTVFSSAPLFELPKPNDTLPLMLPLPAPAVAVTGLATAVASGTDEVPVVISNTDESVVLKFVCAMEISLLSRS